MINFQDRANDIWNIANLLRGYYKQHDYGKVVLPFTILRRLDELLEPTKDKVLAEYEKVKSTFSLTLLLKTKPLLMP